MAVGGLERILRIGAGSLGDGSVGEMMAAHRGATVANGAVEHDDPCWFFFTSGTTGRSKAAVLTHGQMGFVVTNHLCDLMPGTTEEDVSLVVAPLSHGAGVHQLPQAARGVATVLLSTERFDIDEVFRLIEIYRVSNMFTVPTILKMLAEHPAAARHDHSSLRTIIYAGAPMYREDQKTALRVLGKVIVQYFGLGEVTGNITVLPPRLHELEDGPGARIGTCGYERTGMQISIQDDTGRELAPFETGEICVIGPAVFAGYYDNPDANAKAFRNVWGEVGYAVCVVREGIAVSEADLADHLAGKLARYKMPRRFVFFEALPKSGYGKVPKRLVKDELVARGLMPLVASPGAA
eukprot:gene23913-25516_t